MSKIIELIDGKAAKKEAWVSYEFFPPRSETGVKNLEVRFERMRDACRPLFADVTWGAGGSTSRLTIDLTLKLKAMGLEPNMHLTCTNVKREEVVEALKTCRSHDVRNIVALRGDPPLGAEKWEATDASFSCALDLVKFIRAEHGDYFNLAVAGYPEGHPDAIEEVTGETLSASEKVRCRITDDGKVFVCRDDNYKKELLYLKKKIDAGANVVITQMFFDVDTYANFVEEAKKAGITCPIVPGIMVIQNAAGFQKMTSFCKTRVPDHLKVALRAVQHDPDKVKALGIDYGIDMATKLHSVGAPGLHFYTLNLDKATLAIIDALDFLPPVKQPTYTKPPRAGKPGIITYAAIAAFAIITVNFFIRANRRANF